MSMNFSLPPSDNTSLSFVPIWILVHLSNPTEYSDYTWYQKDDKSKKTNHQIENIFQYEICSTSIRTIDRWNQRMFFVKLYTFSKIRKILPVAGEWWVCICHILNMVSSFERMHIEKDIICNRSPFVQMILRNNSNIYLPITIRFRSNLTREISFRRLEMFDWLFH